MSRQSTIGTIGSSIDEGVESDPNGSRYSSSEIEPNGSGNSLLVVNNSPLDSHTEIDLMSSLNSCPNSQENANNLKQPTNNTLTKTTTSNESSPCASPQRKNFGDGWHASDNAVFDSLATAFPTGKLGIKCKATDAVNAQQTKSFWSNTSTSGGQVNNVNIKNIVDRRILQNGGVPKRISLPENLEFQPQVLLNLKQSIHVEKQLGNDNSASVEPKQVLKVRLQQQQQKRLTKARMQLFRQQSYQLAQQKSVIPVNMMNLRIDDSTTSTPLSPIEDDLRHEEMDTS